jgi:phosphoribosylglycinamide formyltransferase-1
MNGTGGKFHSQKKSAAKVKQIMTAEFLKTLFDIDAFCIHITGNPLFFAVLMTRLAVFASGEGTNAENLIQFFRNHPLACVTLVACDKAGAPVIEKANRFQVPVHVFSNEELHSGALMKKILNDAGIGMIALAGYLRKVPVEVIKHYPEKIINLHPALLPAFGGKGMYGMKVHEAVIASGAKESGITIHFVNENYDEGKIIFQKSIPVRPDDSPVSLQKKIRELEIKYYPLVIEKLLKDSQAG